LHNGFKTEPKRANKHGAFFVRKVLFGKDRRSRSRGEFASPAAMTCWNLESFACAKHAAMYNLIYCVACLHCVLRGELKRIVWSVLEFIVASPRSRRTEPLANIQVITFIILTDADFYFFTYRKGRRFIRQRA